MDGDGASLTIIIIIGQQKTKVIIKTLGVSVRCKILDDIQRFRTGESEVRAVVRWPMEMCSRKLFLMSFTGVNSRKLSDAKTDGVPDF